MTTATRKETSSTPPGTRKGELLRFRAGAKDLLTALLPLGGVAPPRSPRPILGHLKVSVAGKRLEVAATDLEMWMTVRTELEGASGEGRFAVPAEPFLQILREAGEKVVEVSCKGGTVAVESGRDAYELACLPVDEFPECAEHPEGAQWDLAAGDLARLLRGTSFAAARERTRYTLNGVHWDADGKRLEVVATDGRRLALARAEAKGQGKGKGIVPVRAVAQMAAIGERPVAVSLGERAVSVRTTGPGPEHTLVSRLLEGQFPDYQAVIPKDYPHRAEAPAADLLGAFRRAALLSQESRAVRLVFHKGGLTLSGGDPGRGQAKVELDLDYQGGDVDLRLNPDFVMEGLKSWGERPVRWELRDSVSPCVLKEGDDHLYVVLPITLE